MARSKHRLTAKQVHALGPGKHADGGGLYLLVEPTGARRWMFRYSFAGKRREQGLGGLSNVSLAQARKKAPSRKASRDPTAGLGRKSGSVPQRVLALDERLTRLFAKTLSMLIRLRGLPAIEA